MDFFGLENYTKGQQDYNPNSDSQVILDDTDDIAMDSQDQIPMETSQSSNTENQPECKSDAENASDNDESETDFNLDINEKLKELNSLFKPQRSGKKNAKTSTPVNAKGKRGRPTKTSSDAITFKTTKQISGKVVEISSGQTGACLRKTRSDETHAQVTAPVRRRSSRLSGQLVSPPKVPPPQPKNRRAPRNQANNTVEVIDLISAPPLVMPGVINLDSDDEDERKHKARQKALHDLSFEDNYEMSIKLRWNGSIQKFPLRKHQCFKDLIDKLAADENVDSSQIILTVNDSKVIRPEDTPDTINYTITMILSGRSITTDFVPQEKANKKPRRDKNMIKVRLQAAGLKNPIEIYIDKTRKFSSTRHTIAEALKVNSDKLKLMFDGDVIDCDESPVDLDFDGGEMIDCEIIN